MREAKDTKLIRLLAIESIASLSDTESIQIHREELDKMDKEMLIKELKHFVDIIDDIYCVAHGITSDCCKGKHTNKMIKPLEVYCGIKLLLK